MHRSTAALVCVAAAVVVTACGESNSVTPRAVSQNANASASSGPATTCDFNAISKAARAYFTSSQDPAFGLISDMKGAANAAAATTIGWQILRDVAAERLSSSTAASSDGAIFVNDVLRCMSVSFPPSPSADVQKNFLDNLTLVLSAGVFNVRGGGSDPTTPAAALDGSPRVLAQPHWGAEAVSSWPTGPILVWGYPLLLANTVVDPATNINTNGSGTYNGFELGTIPNGTAKNGMRVGICYQSVTGTTTANRLIHNSSEILVNNPPSALCSMTQASVSSLPTPWYTRILAQASSFVMPTTAHAMQEGLEIGGLPSSWSPFSSGALLGSNIQLAFTTEPPKSTRVGTIIHVVVHASINGANVPGTDITISVDNNNGTPAGAIITSGNTTVTTGANGDAAFDITIGKAGGYLLAANGSLTGVTTASAISTLFNLKNP